MSVVSTLRQADIFYEFTLTQLELIASICTEHVYNLGDIIFEENTTGDELYLIVEGEIDIQVDPSLVGKPVAGGPVIGSFSTPQCLNALNRVRSSS